MKTNCRDVQNLWVSSPDNRVPENVRARAEEHLKGCGVCRRENELLAASWGLLSAYETPRVSEGFSTSLMRRIHSEQAEGRKRRVHNRRSRRRSRPWRLAWAAAAGLAAAVGLSLLWGRFTVDHGRVTTAPSAARVALRSVTDEEVIRDLEVYENFGLLEKLDFFSDLDVVKRVRGSL